MKHLGKHWHHHLALWGVLLAAFLVGTGAGYAAHRVRGGYRAGPLPARVVLSGGPVPASASLAGYLVRDHDQGDSSSCVGQTIAELEEVHSREVGRPLSFSSGFIWNQLNGGNRYQGTTYQDAFELLRTEGDAPLAAFWPDGKTGETVWPGAGAVAAARAYRYVTWRSIWASDRYTMEAEISEGRPVAVAIPVTDSFYQQWGDGQLPTIWGQSGAFHFWHSMIGIGYDQTGLIVKNSWPGWGYRGFGRLAWGFLGDVGAAVVVAAPPAASPSHRTSPHAPRRHHAAGKKRSTTRKRVKNAHVVRAHEHGHARKPADGPAGHGGSRMD